MQMNKVVLAGYLTRDVEMRYALSGTAVANFGLAMNRKWKTESGEEKEDVCFVDCTAFGRTGETLSQYLRKGDPLLLEGRLKLEQWTEKQTQQPRQKLKVIVESFSFVGNKKDSAEPQGSPAPRQPRPAAPAAEPPLPPEDDDVPF